MERKYICLSVVIMLSAAVLCSCSSGSEGASKAISTVIFILLFLGASLCSAMMTFKLRRKKGSEKDEKDSPHTKKE